MSDEVPVVIHDLDAERQGTSTETTARLDNSVDADTTAVSSDRGVAGYDDRAGVENRRLTASRLNAKLVVAIERQAELEDNLAATRQELAAALAKARTLEEAEEEHKRMLASGVLLQRQDVETETQNLNDKLTAERGQRLSAEGSRKEIEKELEDLTQSLFEEANKMVAVERSQNASLQERNEHLTTQLKDAEILLESHQAQLEELKTVMQRMSAKEESDSRPGSPNPSRGHAHRWSRDSMKGIKTPLSGTFPSPIPSQSEHAETTPLATPTPPTTEMVASRDFSEEQDPEQFAGMLAPRYRTDTIAFADFLSLVHHPRPAPQRPDLSRTASMSSLNGTTASSIAKDQVHARHGLTTPDRVASPTLDRTTSTATALWNRYAESDSKKDKEVPLSQTKFLKRALIEDIEPTLRLDQAPELGYLSRRAILNAVVEGHLIVEPMPAHLARYQPERSPCALCGEARFTPELARHFRLKTSERADSQPYPLCDWCTDRVRSVCTYVAFLRQVKDGLWRATSSTEEMRVWEESVKLREGMFWSRVGHILER